MDSLSHDSVHPGIVCFFPIGAGRQQAQPYSGNRDGKEAGLSEMLIRSMKERARLFLPEEACERELSGETPRLPAPA